jgi:AcrR family transcriptional regulator
MTNRSIRRDPERNQERILKAATDEFARFGLGGARVDRIAERAGRFRNGVDPVQLYISIAGLGYFYLSNRHTLSTIFRRPLLSPKHRAERLKHMTELVLGYLRR